MSSMYNEGIRYPLKGSLAWDRLLLSFSGSELTGSDTSGLKGSHCHLLHRRASCNNARESVLRIKNRKPMWLHFFFFTLHHKTALESGQRRMKADPFNTSVLIQKTSVTQATCVCLCVLKRKTKHLHCIHRLNVRLKWIKTSLPSIGKSCRDSLSMNNPDQLLQWSCSLVSLGSSHVSMYAL